MAPNTILEKYILGDHVELILILFAPLYWLFGSYTLLIIQIIMILFGGLGVYSYLKLKTKDKLTSACGMAIFFLSYGILSALAYDYHNNTVGIMFLPWMLYFFEKRQLKYYYLFLLLFLTSKEDLALIAIFLGISYLIFEKGKAKWHGLATLAISASYFILATKIIIPAFLDSPYRHLGCYQYLGNSLTEIAKNILLHPLATLQILFNQPAKIASWKFFLTTGGILAIWHAPTSILLIPIFAEKFLSDKLTHWGVMFQYSVQFAPIIAIGACLIANRQKIIPKKILLVILLAVNIGSAILTPFNDNSDFTRIFNKKYYSCENCAEIKEAIKIIPPSASVTAHDNILPHMTGRNKIYSLANKIGESEYIIASEKKIYYYQIYLPEITNEITKLKNSDKYETIFNKNGVLVFKKTIINFQDFP